MGGLLRRASSASEELHFIVRSGSESVIICRKSIRFHQSVFPEPLLGYLSNSSKCIANTVPTLPTICTTAKGKPPSHRYNAGPRVPFTLPGC